MLGGGAVYLGTGTGNVSMLEGTEYRAFPMFVSKKLDTVQKTENLGLGAGLFMAQRNIAHRYTYISSRRICHPKYNLVM